MNGLRLGLVGESSDWLIASLDDDRSYRDKLGVSLLKLPMEELLRDNRKGGYENNAWTHRLKEMGYDPEEIEKSLCVYAALDRHFAKEGVITANLREPTLCRTQTRLRLDDFSYFLTKPIRNHHLVCLGGHKAALDELFTQIGN